MAVRPSCITHPKAPDLGCVDCEDQFCHECATELTNRNSATGSDICDPCADRFEQEQQADANEVTQ